SNGGSLGACGPAPGSEHAGQPVETGATPETKGRPACRRSGMRAPVEGRVRGSENREILEERWQLPRPLRVDSSPAAWLASCTQRAHERAGGTPEDCG